MFAVYYCQKAFEFMDTYFFILRKSFRQVRAARPFVETSCTRHAVAQYAWLCGASVVAGDLLASVPPRVHHRHRRVPAAVR